jgi:hypothetical protein
MSGIRLGHAGSHFYKAGLDLARSSLDGGAWTRPVDIVDAAAVLVTRIAFEDGTGWRARGTDVAVFVQDRWQVSNRLLLDGGLRFDRDGVLGSVTVSPRLGVRAGLLPADRMTVGAGIGRFVERTPLTLGALEAFATRVVTAYGADGSPSGSSTRYRPRVGADGLEAPRALTWHVDWSLRISTALSVRAALLDRRGSGEHVVATDTDAAELTVDSRGHSTYRELAIGAHYIEDSRFYADVSYVRSAAWMNTNGYSVFFGTLREPVLLADVFARADSDVPNRLVAQARGQMGAWRLASVLEGRDGLPYSAVDQRQDYVGTPNDAGRLRAFVGLDVSAERRVRLGRFKPWIGVELYNVLNRFNPRDVQRNVDAADAGTLYNSNPRSLLLTVKF